LKFIFVADKVVFLKDGKTTIGRKGTEIELENDASLSRIHAFLILEGDVLKVQDAKSKYGTYLNDKKEESDKLRPEQMIELKDGDSLLFGKFNNEWVAHKLKYKTVISMLDTEKRVKLTKILNELKVPIASEFDSSCSHLTMPVNTSVSHKLLQALTLCKPVVNPKFWVAFQEARENNLPIPKYIDYLPKVKEETFITPDSVSLALNENRRTVFNGKTFIFISSSQLEIYENIIKNGGGKCVAMSKSKVTVTQCCAKNAVVIQCKDNATQSTNDGTISKIRSKF
jgi:nibrin